MFKLRSSFKPTGDQPKAIKRLVKGVRKGLKNQVLLGVTGSGKTFTVANVIEQLQMPALIISHNKTLAGQLYQEMRDFFPDNQVSYFVSYYDYYQPEAYIPQTDTYIEKEAQINELIDKLRLQTTANILTQDDVIVVASVSCIYNIGSPMEYGRFVLELFKTQTISWREISYQLARLQYNRSEFEFKRGSFRIRGERVDIYPAYDDFGYRVVIEKDRVKQIFKFNPLSGENLAEIEKVIIYPAKHYLADSKRFQAVEKEIRADLKKEYKGLKRRKKLIEAQRLIKRVNFDLEMIKEVGYVNGIENYSRYFDGRSPGDPPYTLLDYFRQAYGDRWLLFIDESHMTIPQLRGMYRGDYARKKNLVEFGFRLKAAFDNRPLRFDEFYSVPSHIIYLSATPADWEKKMAMTDSQNTDMYPGIVEQLIRPTGIVDPPIVIRPAKDEVSHLLDLIKKEIKKKGRVLVTTLTKRTAEDLTDFLKGKGIKACYLHSDIETLERSDILDNLRGNKFDVLVGVNLLREGLDLPEVSLVAILDADREGFLRSKTALIQTMGRAARNLWGQVVIYADEITKSIQEAIDEIERRRRYQLAYNKKHNILPKTIYKPIREKIIEKEEKEDDFLRERRGKKGRYKPGLEIDFEALTPYDRRKLIKKLKREMKKEAEGLNFERAIEIRELIKKLKN